jgi:hypothetical protein
MVPQARRRGGRGGRPNLADLLMERAMDPALEQKSSQVAERVDDMLGHLFSKNGF